MATYRIYPDRNAWLASNVGECVEVAGSLAMAKLEAERIGWRWIQVINAQGDGRSWMLWRLPSAGAASWQRV